MRPKSASYFKLLYMYMFLVLPSQTLGTSPGRRGTASPEEGLRHTPSIAFRHFPPNSARIGYATEGALYLRAAVRRRRVQELCESRGGRPGLPSLINLPTVSVDVNKHFNQPSADAGTNMTMEATERQSTT